MKSTIYAATSHAKVILVGEHAVLRGRAALVSPLINKQFKLLYDHSKKLNINSDANLQALFWRTFDKALVLANKSLEEVPGTFKLENNIEIGSGIGFSAALCVAIARWFDWMQWIAHDDVFRFAKQLEDLFHGKSSGLDIVGAMSQSIARYQIDHPHFEFTPKWQPNLYLSFTQQVSITRQCINEVAKIWQSDPQFAQSIDDKMEASVEIAYQALTLTDTKGLSLLQHALNQACTCFYDWNLISAPVQEHINLLRKKGALAVKPTGAGLGGYVLSLWEKRPPFKLLKVAWPAQK